MKTPQPTDTPLILPFDIRCDLQGSEAVSAPGLDALDHELDLALHSNADASRLMQSLVEEAVQQVEQTLEDLRSDTDHFLAQHQRGVETAEQELRKLAFGLKRLTTIMMDWEQVTISTAPGSDLEPLRKAS